jgi:hypothetical protein
MSNLNFISWLMSQIKYVYISLDEIEWQSDHRNFDDLICRKKVLLECFITILNHNI